MDYNELAQQLSIEDLLEIIKIKKQEKNKEDDLIQNIKKDLINKLGKDHSISIAAKSKGTEIRTQITWLKGAIRSLERYLVNYDYDIKKKWSKDVL